MYPSAALLFAILPLLSSTAASILPMQVSKDDSDEWRERQVVIKLDTVQPQPQSPAEELPKFTWENGNQNTNALDLLSVHPEGDVPAHWLVKQPVVDGKTESKKYDQGFMFGITWGPAGATTTVECTLEVDRPEKQRGKEPAEFLIHPVADDYMYPCGFYDQQKWVKLVCNAPGKKDEGRSDCKMGSWEHQHHDLKKERFPK